ncbi:PepSY-associated TM helix domain-containing protein [Pontibacter harenae]|uniref:PepSY-associated TM helix domain-containing protein n=1 Tax=Pontibacter harenae TaxID=2894083 RepID=UPI001E4DE89F|nr:PepSY-associated TM helix domain-containing protein [Pontibacter harenae]MCC9168940.1 PepSY domain-containing protein [Pontibacter harenae]
MTFKKTIGKLHLWLGFASGLLVLFLSITGCILAFQREIEDVTQPYRFVEQQELPALPPSKLKEIADAQLPGKHAHSVGYTKGMAAQVMYFSLAEPAYYFNVYLNPYTGEVLKVKDMDKDFFRFMIMGHYYLWLPPDIGQPVLASATLIFVVLMITGLVLWWPKNKAARKQRFSIKWGAKWRRVNYDAHNVLGFYMTWVAIFIAISGLVMGFQWFSKSVYWVASGGEQLVEFYEPLSDTTGLATDASVPAIDRIWQLKYPALRHTDAKLEVHVPNGKSGTIETAINPDPDTYWKTDYQYYDQYTLKEIPVTHVYGRFGDTSVADKIMRMNYDIHVGAIGGIAGKIIAFLASLLAGSMPVTGFMIWWGRKKKNKKTKLAEVQVKVKRVGA